MIGTLADPFDLPTALSAPNIRGGDTIALVAGVYSGNFSGVVGGTVDAPIVVDGRGGAVIEGSITTSGMSNIEFRNLEIRATWGGSRNYAGNSIPDKYSRVIGNRVKFVNCVIHDIAQLDYFSNAVDCELYGCLFYNNGVAGTDYNKLHNVYTQNNPGGTKKITNCIFNSGFSQFTLHAYAEGGNLINYEITGNVVMPGAGSGGIFLVGGATPVKNLTLSGNWIGAIARVGYSHASPQDAVINDNHFFANLEAYYYKNLQVRRNKFLSGGYNLQCFLGAADDHTVYDIDDNEYWNDGDIRFHMRPWGQAPPEYYGLTSWQNGTGLDVNSTQTNTLANFDGVTVQPNAYDSGRAHVIVVNSVASDDVVVDVSSIVPPGGSYILRNSQDYYVDIQTGPVAQDGTISLDMRAGSHSLAMPIDFGQVLMAKSFPTFGCFVLERQ